MSVAFLVALLIGALAARGPWNAAGRARELVRLAPGLDPDVAQHIIADPDEQWFGYCRRIGAGELAYAFGTLRAVLRTPSYPVFLERRKAVREASVRVGQAFRRVYGFIEPLNVIVSERTMTPKEVFDLMTCDRDYGALAMDTRHPAPERLRRVDEIVAKFREVGQPYRAIMAEMVAIPIELEDGRADRHRGRIEIAIRDARRVQQDYALCQLLGQLGVVHSDAGREDSMKMCFDEGIQIALKHGFLDQAARFYRFYAVSYAEHGRLALALDRLAEAQRLCDQAGGESIQLRLQVEHAKLLAKLGCWDLVDRSLRGIPPLMRAYPSFGHRLDYAKFAFDIDRLRAGVAFAREDPGHASELMRGWLDAVPSSHRRVGLAELFDDWSAGLETAGQAQEALAICDRGLIHCDSTHVPEHEGPLLARRARLLLQLGRLAEVPEVVKAADSVLSARSSRTAGLQMELETTRARWMDRRGFHARAREHVRSVFDQFRLRLRHGDAAALSHLELEDAVTLRDAMHEIEGYSPRDGYEFELEWRSLSKEIGRDHRDGAAIPSYVRPPMAVLAPHDAHLVFHFVNGALLRWTATPGGVLLDTLPISDRQCLAEIREIRDLLQTESPGASGWLGPRATEKLRPLSRLLLPTLAPTSKDHPGTLYISPDGPLLAMPFEALLESGVDGDRPLALTRDVAYVNGRAGLRRDDGGPAVIVSNPKISPELRRRHGWETRLAGSAAESEAARARWPDARLLSGESATKEAVLANWPGASIIYLAAHHLQAPDAPFLGFVPLAAPPGSAPEAALLELADIHALDLSACRLAVLASCSSGAPYRLALRPGPSLGDAFLDAGAGAVVQSFWDVGDEEARSFMKAFLSTWREDGSDVAALNRARRQVMRTGASPRVWAAWSLKTMLRGATSGGAIAVSAR